MNSYTHDELVVVRRSVKHIRLRVRENCSVEAIVPLQFNDTQIQDLLDAKAKWIEKARSFFKSHPATLSDEPNGLLLFGQVFKFVCDAELGNVIAVDEEDRIIRTSNNLQSEEVRLKWFRTFAREFLRQRTKELAAVHAFSFNRIYVMNQRTVWGNCSKKQNISLNWQLIRAPRFVIDYVVLHELLHTRFMSHGQPFWRSMSHLSERYQEAIAWLNNNRPAIDGKL